MRSILIIIFLLFLLPSCSTYVKIKEKASVVCTDLTVKYGECTDKPCVRATWDKFYRLNKTRIEKMLLAERSKLGTKGVADVCKPIAEKLIMELWKKFAKKECECKPELLKDKIGDAAKSLCEAIEKLYKELGDK